jgi:peptide/nickel transport system substrate-binding protein
MRVRIALALLVLAAACGGDDGTTTEGGAGGQESQAAALPFDQQTVTFATPGDVYITRDRVTLGMWPDNANICETLVGLDDKLQPVPVLATKWTYTGNNTFRFELRRGVTFQNGAPFTAEAVRTSMARIVDKRLTLTTFVAAESTKVVDEYTVDITTTHPNLRLPEQISHPNFSIVAPGTDPATRPVCTGPFQFAEYIPNDHFTAVRYESYWGEKPKLKELTFRFIPDQTTRRLALESGSVDGIWFLPPQQVASVKQRSGLQVLPTPPGAVVVLSMNLAGEDPFTLMQDIDLRRALAWSLNPRALADQQWQGAAEPLATVAPPSVLGPAASQIQPITSDLARAERVLDEKGWIKGSDGIREKDGRKLSLVAPAQFDFEPESLQFIQAQAKRAGIDLRVEKAADGADYSNKINSGRWDVDINYWNQNDGNPASILSRLWYGKNTATRIRFTNAGDTFNNLVDQAVAAPDTATSAQKSVDAMRVLLNEEAKAIPLTSFPQIWAMKTTVAGFKVHPSVNLQPWTSVYRTG